MFDEFRIVVAPRLEDPSQWSVHVQEAPRAIFKGPQAGVQPLVTPANLAQLRNPTAAPDAMAMRTLGTAVLNSIMSPQTQQSLRISIDDAAQQNRGLRIVVAITGNTRAPGVIGCHELPLEAAFLQTLDFLATNVRTPVSRGVSYSPDRQPCRLAPPLRILAVASEPTDMPPVNAAAEEQAITMALANLTNLGSVSIDFCRPPTATQLNTMLQKQRYHIVHFIGHGDFEIVGPDQNPQPHLYLEDETPARQRRSLDVDQLYTILRNGNVPVVVMSACSTAASAPNGQDYPALAFEGLAQALVERHSGPLAVVAMQFDFETAAASLFSGAFYQALLNQSMSIDAAVAAARAALMGRFTSGHRCWINPTVYWRCKGGIAFEFEPTGGVLSPEQEAHIIGIDSVIAEYEELLRQWREQPQELQQATVNTRDKWETKIQTLLERRGQVMGETIRLRGGRVVDDHIKCELSLRLRTGATIGDIETKVSYDPNEFEFVQSSASNQVPANSVLVSTPAGQPITVLVRNASNNAQWPAGEYPLVDLRFRCRNTGRPMLRIPVSQVSVMKNGAVDPAIRALDAIVFGS